MAKRSAEKLKWGLGAVDPYIHIYEARFSDIAELILDLSPEPVLYQLRMAQEKLARTKKGGRIDGYF